MNRCRYLIFYILFFLFVSGEICYGQATHDANRLKSKLVTVSGLVTATSTYFGGVPPSLELMKALATPKPLANFNLFIKEGIVNSEKSKIYKSIKTDDSGRFTVLLKVGQIYCFVNQEKALPFKVPPINQYTDWDIDCLKLQYATPDFILVVKEKENRFVSINYHDDHTQPCNRLPTLSPP